jgi:GntR family transcriptional regulator/MocR family aminotransferase
MIPIILSDDTNIAVYKRIASAVEEGISQAKLSPGTKMPSSRELAVSLGVSRGSVVRAYEELIHSGHLFAQAGGQTFVAEKSSHKQILSNGHSAEDDSEQNPENVSEFAKRLSKFSWSIGSAADIPLLNYGAPPEWALPVSKWKYALNKTCDDLSPASIEYAPPPFGDFWVREVLCEFLRRRQGIQANVAQTIVFADSESSLVYIARLLVNVGDVVLVENPCHAGARDTFSTHGAHVITVPIDEDGIRTDIVEEYLNNGPVKLIYVSPSFQDPVGVNMSLARRHRLLKLAKAHNVCIVEDAWDSDYSYISPNFPPLFTLSQHSNVFFIYSFWKLLYPLSMVGCLVIPPRYAATFAAAKVQSNGINPVIEHRTLADFIESGNLEKHIKLTRKQLTIKRQSLIALLVTLFGKDVQIKKRSSAFWLIVEFSEALMQGDIENMAADNNIVLFATDCYYSDPRKIPAREYMVPFADY